MEMQFEIKNLPLEKPPPTDIPTNPKNSWWFPMRTDLYSYLCVYLGYMTSLTNLCIANGKVLKIKVDSEGDAHMPQWTSVCLSMPKCSKLYLRY